GGGKGLEALAPAVPSCPEGCRGCRGSGLFGWARVKVRGRGRGRFRAWEQARTEALRPPCICLSHAPAAWAVRPPLLLVAHRSPDRRGQECLVGGGVSRSRGGGRR
ncbi:unnamed protein product, partial [Discosporangium mesarthrocarpum]